MTKVVQRLTCQRIGSGATTSLVELCWLGSMKNKYANRRVETEPFISFKSDLNGSDRKCKLRMGEQDLFVAMNGRI